jgi:hypothetical protein
MDDDETGAFISLLLQKVGVFRAGSASLSLEDQPEGGEPVDRSFVSPRSGDDHHEGRPIDRPAAWALPMDFAATSSDRLRPGGKVLGKLVPCPCHRHHSFITCHVHCCRLV